MWGGGGGRRTMTVLRPVGKIFRICATKIRDNDGVCPGNAGLARFPSHLAHFEGKNIPALYDGKKNGRRGIVEEKKKTRIATYCTREIFHGGLRQRWH